jgi:hypothetical protein
LLAQLCACGCRRGHVTWIQREVADIDETLSRKRDLAPTASHVRRERRFGARQRGLALRRRQVAFDEVRPYGDPPVGRTQRMIRRPQNVFERGTDRTT